MAKKDSYWFRHDSGSGRGLRMLKMQHIHNHWGKGVYWDVIEILRSQDGYRYEHSEFALDSLSSLVMVSDKIRFLNWFNDCIKIGLFEKDEKYFFSPVLIENMKNWETKKTNGSKGGRPKKTETITEIKPKHKANQNHKIRLDNIIYIKEFFENSQNDEIWIDQSCITLGLTKENFIKGFVSFKDHIKSTDLEKQDTLKEWRKYSINWIRSKIDVLNLKNDPKKLNGYSTNPNQGNL